MKQTALVLAGLLSLVASTTIESEDIISTLAARRKHALRQDKLNMRPIIGVLTQPIDDGMK